MLSKLSKHDLGVILDISYQCLETETPAEVVSILNRLNDLVFFKAAAIGVQKSPADAPSALAWINHSFPREWISWYADNNFQEADPVVCLAEKANDPFTWKQARTYAGNDNQKTALFLNSAKQAGVYNGIAVSTRLKGKPFKRTLMAVDTGKERIQDSWPIILSLVLPHIHHALARINTPEKTLATLFCHLSERETETLKWAAQGKSAWEIGQILGISQRTVKFHLGNIFTKLNVVNRAQAVAVAMSLGII